MIETKQNRPFIAYIVMGLLFVAAVVFNDFISIAGVRPDLLMIILLYLIFNEKPVIAIIAAFGFGFLQDVFLPGYIQYWGLSPLLKTLIIYGVLKLLPFFERMRGFYFLLTVFGVIFIHNVFYNLFYYSGYINSFVALYRYSLPETVYTFLILLILDMIFPLNSKNR